jgi:hypothetical protein
MKRKLGLATMLLGTVMAFSAGAQMRGHGGGGGAHGFSGGGHAYSGRSFGGGHYGGAPAIRGGEGFRGGVGRGYYGGNYYRGGGYYRGGYGWYGGAPYLGFGYGYAPSSCGYYDSWGRWIPTACYVDPNYPY